MKRVLLDGDAIAYRDEGTGPAVVFVHGTPSSSAEFAEVIAALSGQFRCVAIDHLGFGESAKPEHGDYSITAHHRRLTALLEHLAVREFHLVVHDFGGAIALPMVIDHPERVISLTLMNTWLWPLAETEPALNKQAPLLRSALMAFLYRRLNFSARVLVKAAWGSHRPLTREHHRRYMSAFKTAQERNGTVAFLKTLLDPHEPAWAMASSLASHAPRRTLLLWGMGDRVITPATLRRWTDLLPAARVVELPNVGHFVADEAPELVVRELKGFLADDGAHRRTA